MAFGEFGRVAHGSSLRRRLRSTENLLSLVCGEPSPSSMSALVALLSLAECVSFRVGRKGDARGEVVREHHGQEWPPKEAAGGRSEQSATVKSSATEPGITRPGLGELTIATGSGAAGCFSDTRCAGSSRAIFIKMSAVLSLSVVVVISPDSDGVGCENSSSRRPSRAWKARSRWLAPTVSSLRESSNERRAGMSGAALLRDDRKARMGGITARPPEVLAALVFAAVVSVLLDKTGGREFSAVLGNSNSRWPCADSLTALSVRRRLTTGVTTDSADDRVPGASFVGNDAGRLDAGDDPGVAVFVEGRTNLRERVLVAPPVCFVSKEAALSGRVCALRWWWRALCASRRGSAVSQTTSGASGVGCCSEGSEMRSFRRSTNRNAGSLDELWFWRCACRIMLSLVYGVFSLLLFLSLLLLMLLAPLV